MSLTSRRWRTVRRSRQRARRAARRRTRRGPGHRHRLGHRGRRVRPGRARRDDHPHQRSHRGRAHDAVERARRVHVPRRATRILYRARRVTGFRAIDNRNNVVNASGQLNRRQAGARDRRVERSGDGEFPGDRDRDDQQRLLEPAHRKAARADSDTRPRRHVAAQADARRAGGKRHRGDGRSFGSNVPNINGMRRAWNQVTVDGLNGNELSGTARFSSAINLDAIAEVKVLLNTYKAEFGRTGGANIEIVSKSGSTDYKGGAYWYGRRDQWNANTWENQPRRRGQSQAAHRHLRLQSRRSGEAARPDEQGEGQQTVLLLLARSATGAAPRADASVPRADAARAPGQLLAVGRYDRPRRHRRRSVHAAAVPRQHHSGQPHRPEPAEAAEHAAGAEPHRRRLHV